MLSVFGICMNPPQNTDIAERCGHHPTTSPVLRLLAYTRAVFGLAETTTWSRSGREVGGALVVD